MRLREGTSVFIAGGATDEEREVAMLMRQGSLFFAEGVPPSFSGRIRSLFEASISNSVGIGSSPMMSTRPFTFDPKVYQPVAIVPKPPLFPSLPVTSKNPMPRAAALDGAGPSKAAVESNMHQGAEEEAARDQLPPPPLPTNAATLPPSSLPLPLPQQPENEEDAQFYDAAEGYDVVIGEAAEFMDVDQPQASIERAGAGVVGVVGDEKMDQDMLISPSLGSGDDFGGGGGGGSSSFGGSAPRSNGASAPRSGGIKPTTSAPFSLGRAGGGGGGQLFNPALDMDDEAMWAPIPSSSSQPPLPLNNTQVSPEDSNKENKGQGGEHGSDLNPPQSNKRSKTSTPGENTFHPLFSSSLVSLSLSIGSSDMFVSNRCTSLFRIGGAAAAAAAARALMMAREEEEFDPTDNAFGGKKRGRSASVKDPNSPHPNLRPDGLEEEREEGLGLGSGMRRRGSGVNSSREQSEPIPSLFP